MSKPLNNIEGMLFIIISLCIIYMLYRFWRYLVTSTEDVLPKKFRWYLHETNYLQNQNWGHRQNDFVSNTKRGGYSKYTHIDFDSIDELYQFIKDRYGPNFCDSDVDDMIIVY